MKIKKERKKERKMLADAELNPQQFAGGAASAWTTAS